MKSKKSDFFLKIILNYTSLLSLLSQLSQLIMNSFIIDHVHVSFENNMLRLRKSKCSDRSVRIHFGSKVLNGKMTAALSDGKISFQEFVSKIQSLL